MDSVFEVSGQVPARYESSSEFELESNPDDDRLFGGDGVSLTYLKGFAGQVLHRNHKDHKEYVDSLYGSPNVAHSRHTSDASTVVNAVNDNHGTPLSQRKRPSRLNIWPTVVEHDEFRDNDLTATSERARLIDAYQQGEHGGEYKDDDEDQEDVTDRRDHRDHKVGSRPLSAPPLSAVETLVADDDDLDPSSPRTHPRITNLSPKSATRAPSVTGPRPPSSNPHLHRDNGPISQGPTKWRAAAPSSNEAHEFFINQGDQDQLGPSKDLHESAKEDPRTTQLFQEIAELRLFIIQQPKGVRLLRGFDSHYRRQHGVSATFAMTNSNKGQDEARLQEDEEEDEDEQYDDAVESIDPPQEKRPEKERETVAAPVAAPMATPGVQTAPAKAARAPAPARTHDTVSVGSQAVRASKVSVKVPTPHTPSTTSSAPTAASTATPATKPITPASMPGDDLQNTLLYSALELDGVDRLSLIQAHNLIKNILLQLDVKFSCTQDRVSAIGTAVRSGDKLLDFAHQVHRALYNGETIRLHKGHSLPTNECLDTMASSVRKMTLNYRSYQREPVERYRSRYGDRMYSMYGATGDTGTGAQFRYR